MLKRFLSAVCASLVLAGAATAQVNLNGAGASFPRPLYDKLIGEYQRINPAVQINYVSSGSGAGIKQFSEGTIDFGGTDSPMKDSQLKAATGGLVHHIPTAIGAVVPIYNIPGVTDLKFTGPVLADIFEGKISKWNDPKIAQINPDAKLPDAGITVVHRSDGSGTTAIFTDYLSKVSASFKDTVGSGTSVKWTSPNAIGAKGNEQVAANVQRAPNSIGYVELIYAMANKIKFAPVQNKAGQFITASIEATSAAAGDLTNAPDDLRMSITNSDAKDAYPIAGLTYILVYDQQKDEAKGKALVDFLWWVTHDAQAVHPTLYYAPLPAGLVKKVEAKLQSIKGPNGQPLLKR